MTQHMSPDNFKEIFELRKRILLENAIKNNDRVIGCVGDLLKFLIFDDGYMVKYGKFIDIHFCDKNPIDVELNVYKILKIKEEYIYRMFIFRNGDNSVSIPFLFKKDDNEIEDEISHVQEFKNDLIEYGFVESYDIDNTELTKMIKYNKENDEECKNCGDDLDNDKYKCGVCTGSLCNDCSINNSGISIGEAGWLELNNKCDKCLKFICSDCISVCYSCNNEDYTGTFCINCNPNLQSVDCEYHTWPYCDKHEEMECPQCAANKGYHLRYKI